MGEDGIAEGHAFISYVHLDSEAADAIQASLEAADVLVWRDTAQIWPGENWRARIRQAITGDAFVFLACFSSAGLAVDRSGQHEELLLAVDELRQRHPGVPWLIPVRLDECEIPDLEIGAGQTLRSLRPADIFGDERQAELNRLVAAVTRILGAAQPGRRLQPGPVESGRQRGSAVDGTDAGCPYPGLAAFTTDQAKWFFGRDRLTADLLMSMNDCLTGAGPLMVVAASGAGKSSLLRAGLLHKIAEGRLTPAGSRHWPQIVITPGEAPMAVLASALQSHIRQATDATTCSPVVGPGDLDDMLRVLLETVGAKIGHSARAVIIIDQFEELFTLCRDETERRAFIAWLWQVADHDAPGGPAGLVACGISSDFYSECARYPQLRQALRGNQVIAGSMSQDDLRQAIRRPAEAVGLRIEPGLVEVLLRDLRAETAEPRLPRVALSDEPEDYDAGRLPLLAHVLQATWQQRHGNTLTVDGYLTTGGIEHAIAKTAERLYGRLDNAGQREAHAMFLRLVKIGQNLREDVRRPIRRPDLIGQNNDEAAIAVDAFVAGRLLTSSRGTIQITHEALIRAWPRLRGWLEDDRAGNLVRQDLEDAAADWEHSGDPSLLYRGARLQAANTWAAGHSNELSPTARRFLTASGQASRRSMILRRSAVTTLSILFVLASVAAVIAFQQRSAALVQRNRAVSAQAVAAANQVGASSPALTAQLLLEAYRAYPSVSLATRLVSTENELLPSPISSNDSHSPMVALAFSPDGHTLASGRDSGVVELWDVTDPAHARRLARFLAVSRGSLVDSMVFNANGRTLAIGDSIDGAVELWDVTDPTHPRQLSRILAAAASLAVAMPVAFSPDGRILATGSGDGAVELLNVTDPTRPRLLSRTPAVVSRENDVWSVAFNPSGRILAVGGSGIDGAIELLNVTDPAHPRTLDRSVISRHGSIASLAFSPDGRILATCGDRGATGLWDVTDPARPRRITRSLVTDRFAGVGSIAFSPDGRTLATSSSTVELWDISDPHNPRRLASVAPIDGGPASLAFDPDGRTLATGGSGAVLWNLPATLLTSSSNGISVAFSPNGRTLATSGSDQGAIELWDVANPTRPRLLARFLAAHGGTIVYTVAFSPDSRTLAIGTVYGRVKLWDVTDPAHPRQLTWFPAASGQNAVMSVAFSPDGRTLAASTSDGAIELWDVTSRAYPRQLSRSLDTNSVTIVYSVTFSPDGRTLAAGDEGGAIELWNVTNPGQPNLLARSVISRPYSVGTVAFSPDGRILATGSNSTMELWDITDRVRPKLLSRSVAAGNFAVESVAFSPDGRSLATSIDDGRIEVWNVTNPAHPSRPTNPIATSRPTGPIAMALSPDGRTIANGNTDSVIQLWNLNISYAIRRICSSTTLTQEQWHHYIAQLPYSSPCAQ